MECNFCRSGTQDNYIYTECSHLVCLSCASLKWDRKYSLKCCNRTTFLQEDTCIALEKLSQASKEESKENVPSLPPHTLAPKPKDDYVCTPTPKHRDVQQSIYIAELEGKSQEKIQVGEGKNDNCLAEMEEAMNESVHRVKVTFEMYRKELERREQALLKDIYNRYSDQLSKYTLSEQDARDFRERVSKLIADELSCFGKFSGVREKEKEREEGRPDKILEKLEYNQLKMKEKINRHYELLK